MKKDAEKGGDVQGMIDDVPECGRKMVLFAKVIPLIQ